MKNKPTSDQREPDWATPEGRFIWLLEHQYGSSRSKMAKAIGISMTGLVSVIKRQQKPGRYLIEAVVKNTHVDANWLLTGKGRPHGKSHLPVATGPLPGRPEENKSLLVDEDVRVLTDVYSPTRYWLKIRAGDPIVRDMGRRIRAGDYLLMETDREQFPELGRWEEDELCVIKLDTKTGTQATLAAVTHYPGYTAADGEGVAERLEAYVFDQSAELVRQTVINRRAGAEPQVIERMVWQPKQKNAKSRLAPGAERRVYADVSSRKIEYSDVIAICLLIVSPRLIKSPSGP